MADDLRRPAGVVDRGEVMKYVRAMLTFGWPDLASLAICGALTIVTFLAVGRFAWGFLVGWPLGICSMKCWAVWKATR